MKINFICSILLFSFFSWGCGGRGIVLTRSRLLMGHVPVNIQIRTGKARQALALSASQAAYGEAERLEGLLSEYRENSEISCLNARAGKGACHLSPQTQNLLKKALEISRQTDGAFDIRFLSLSREGRRSPVTLDPETGEAYLRHPETRLGLGAIAKGYIVEAMSEELRRQGFPDHLINAGGDLVARGEPWEVALQVPGALPGEFVDRRKIKDRAVATSGSYEQEGHILDPRSGRKINRRGSVTVLARDLTTADALSTAFFVLGESLTPQYLKKFPGVEAIWLKP